MPSNVAADSAYRSGSTLDHVAIELTRQLIRLKSVNDGTPESGQEMDAALVLRAFIEEADAEVDVRILESAPGRASIIARLRGSDPDAASLGLVGHLDVVPADSAHWTHDPFAAEIIDDELWGRGSVDMLYLTACFATAFRDVAARVRAGESLAGDLVFLGVADEEGGSRLGMQWLAENYPDLIAVDEVLTEAGGMRVGERVAVSVAEKGSAARRLHVTGRAGHASAPHGTENAIDALSEVVRRLGASQGEPPVIHELWRQFVDARWGSSELAAELSSATQIDAALPQIDRLAGYAHAVTRTTVSPTVVRAGQAHNVIPATATVDLDIRPLPGVTDDDVDTLLTQMLGDLASIVRIERLFGWSSSASSTDTALYQLIGDVVQEQLGCQTLPLMAAGGSDARFFRYQGVPAYGFAVLSDAWSYEEYRSRIHSHDERIDLDSIQLTLRALGEIVTRRLRVGED